MEQYHIENLSFAYPHAKTYALKDVSFNLEQGEFLCVCGQSGCGKTTLLRLLKPLLSPNGALSGQRFFENIPLEQLSPTRQATEIGFVLQNPEAQIVTDKVWHELAFGLESLGLANEQIRTRVSEMASFFGLETLFHRDTASLSGGQKQLLNLASVMVMQPKVLLLDEPTAMLDPIAADAFLDAVLKINKDFGTTVILCEHRLEKVFPMADKVLYMQAGKRLFFDTPDKVGSALLAQHLPLAEALPVSLQVSSALDTLKSYPLTVRDGRCWLSDYTHTHSPDVHNIPLAPDKEISPVVLEAKDVSFRYTKDGQDVLKSLNVSVHKGEIFALLGANGSGKSTLLQVFAGVLHPHDGLVSVGGQNIRRGNVPLRLAMLPQNPLRFVVKDTVKEDLSEVLDTMSLSKEEKDRRLQEVLTEFALQELSDKHPYDLSGGEIQRHALAKLILTKPDILLLDEPTKGLDVNFKNALATMLFTLKKRGLTVVLVSHDMEFCAKFSDTCALLFDGAITACGHPRNFFTGNRFYTTSAARLASGILPNVLLPSDILAAFSQKAPDSFIPSAPKPMPQAEPYQEDSPAYSCSVLNKKPRSAAQLMTVLLTVLLVGVTGFIGFFGFETRSYYTVSLLMLLEIFVSYCFLFEARKPKAREIVTVSVLCALAVAGRVAFFMTPQFKPTAAVVILSGLAFGPATGFLVGAVSGFVSNFFFGQGPWSPWQMLALALIGLVFGFFKHRKAVQKNRLLLCTLGFVAVLVIYGGILNPISVFMIQPNPTLSMMVAAYATGLPFDMIHALSTAFFLFVLANPVLSKCERVSDKYGLAMP